MMQGKETEMSSTVKRTGYMRTNLDESLDAEGLNPTTEAKIRPDARKNE
jgi:hypothetical protein